MFGVQRYGNCQILIYRRCGKLVNSNVCDDAVTSFRLFLVKTSRAGVKNIVKILPEV